MNILEEIKKRIIYLPKKDIPLANKFINKRDFISLRELVDSAEYKIRTNVNSDNPKQEYLDIDLEELENLQYYVSVYAKQFDDEEYDLNYLYEI